MVIPYRFGSPAGITAFFKVCNEDFCVDELQTLSALPEGEHVWLKVWKSGENTQFVAEKLANFAGVRHFDVGYAGRKDRHAVTTQWFSVWLPDASKEPVWTEMNSETIKILNVKRQKRKLRRGEHKGNRFHVRLRDIRNEDASFCKQDIETKLAEIKKQGIPNYFGEQRFGCRGDNLVQALNSTTLNNRRPSKKGKRINAKEGLYLSAVRSWLFNQILALHVKQNLDFPQVKHGSLFGMLSRKDEDERAALSVNSECYQAIQIEQSVFERYPEFTELLLNCGLKRENRLLYVTPTHLNWNFQSVIEAECNVDRIDLAIEFVLPVGSYATILLRELVELKQNE